jgi:hypothetical protein
MAVALVSDSSFPWHGLLSILVRSPQPPQDVHRVQSCNWSVVRIRVRFSFRFLTSKLRAAGVGVYDCVGRGKLSWWQRSVVCIHSMSKWLLRGAARCFDELRTES